MAELTGWILSSGLKTGPVNTDEMLYKVTTYFEIVSKVIITTCLFIYILIRVTDSLFAASTTGDLPHAGDWITNPDCPFYGDYPGASEIERQRCREGIKKRGYTHHYIIGATGTDSRVPVYNLYDNPTLARSRLLELKNDGIKVSFWLTSDSAPWRNQTISKIKSDLTTLIPAIDDLVVSYSLAIETDEYWTKLEAMEVGNHLRTLTNKPVSVHQLPGRWDYCKGENWCDYVILQYGFNKTESQIKTMTINAINDLGKPIVAGEYCSISQGCSESTSIKLGDAAVSAGASGFANGGTANIVSPTNTPTLRPGDANGDGLVNIADYVIWLTNYNKNLSGASNGDFNSNGKVDGIDFIIWLKNYTG